MYRHSVLAGAILAAAVTAMSAASANAQQFQATLTGFEELGAINAQTGAIFTPGQGTLALNLNQQAGTLTFTLSYSGLTSTVQQAHIHFGKLRDSGGIMVFFCTNLGNGPPGTTTQACPQSSGTVSGTITAANVIAIPKQNFPVNNFPALAAALLSDTAYANVHTVNFPAGEIRGQVLQSENQQGNQNQP